MRVPSKAEVSYTRSTCFMVLYSHTNHKAFQERANGGGGRGRLYTYRYTVGGGGGRFYTYGYTVGGGRGRLYTYGYTVATGMTPALRWQR